MKMKPRISKKKGDETEKDLLIQDHVTRTDSIVTNNNNNNKPKGTVRLKRMDSKVSMFAPEAHETDFQDVPVLTICPHCSLKVVTKTGYNKKSPCCLCCCSQDFLFMFKDIQHTCPKCNQLVATYNRFCFTWRNRIHLKKAAKDLNQLNDITEEIQSRKNELDVIGDDEEAINRIENNHSAGGGEKAAFIKHEINDSGGESTKEFVRDASGRRSMMTRKKKKKVKRSETR